MKKFLLISTILLLLYSIGSTYKIINSKPQIVSHTDTIPGDTMFTVNTVYQPKPYKVIVPIHDTIYIPTSLDQCIDDYKKLYKEYTTARFYRDTVQNDSSMTISVYTVTNRNEVSSLQVSAKNNRPTIINNTIVTYSNKLPILSAGLIGGYQLINPYIEYTINNKLSILGGYNTYNNSPTGGLKYTIFSK